MQLITGLWLTAALLCLAFFAWYENWRGPLTPEEIEAYMGRFADNAESQTNQQTDPAVLHAFLDGDDGGEFFMLNLVRLRSRPVPDPVTGEKKSAPELMEGYTKKFFKELGKRAGHPAIMAGVKGGHIDSWGTAENPGWTNMGYMRYRSRRDLMELATDPQFEGGHIYKLAAIPSTFSVPTKPQFSALAGPRVWVPMTLTLLAALASMGVLLFRP